MPDDRPSGWLSGLIVPVTTPFDPATGGIAPVTWRDNLRRWVREGVNGVVLFGSNGEGALLDESEKQKLVGYARDVIPADVTLLGGTSAESTRGTVSEARALAEAGVEAVLVHPPAYFGSMLSPAALRDHFEAVADGSPVPVVIYHIPKYTRVVIEPGLMAEIVRHPNVVGLKDSSGEMKRFADYSNACGRACRLLIGSGALLYTALELGAAGGIVAVGLLAPALCGELIASFRAGDARRAGQLQERLAPLHRDIVSRLGPPGVKAALELLGYGVGGPRPPLRPVGESQRRDVARLLQNAGLI